MKTVIISIAAKSVHKSLAPWCLKAYCEENGISGIEIIESNINCAVNEITAKIFAAAPDIAAFSCYIWNIEYVAKIGSLIKKMLPGVRIILGGPEVSYEEDLKAFPFADYIVRGAAEEVFCGLLNTLWHGGDTAEKIIEGRGAGFRTYPTPFTEDFFNSFESNRQNIAGQIIYYESSRGCPFSCSYCLSSASKGVLYSDIGRIKAELTLLAEKGARLIKFVDRTFNADAKRAGEILEFILGLDTCCSFHFEAAADLFTERLLRIIEKMPAGKVQFEIGIQSVNPEALCAADRKTDIGFALENIKKLISFKNCHIHLDLIAGLPHESLDTFSDAISRCILCAPHMLQIGFLKMLKGTKMRLSSAGFGAEFAEFPPYEVCRTDTLSCRDIIRLKQIEGVVDKFYNSGAFTSSINYAAAKLFDSPYGFFDALSDVFPDSESLKISMKNAYTMLLDFLLRHGAGKAEAEHLIKLDCLSVDSRGLLPDDIKPARDKKAEAEFRKQPGKSNANIRIEYFSFDNTYKLYDYGSKNPMSGRFECRNVGIDAAELKP